MKNKLLHDMKVTASFFADVRKARKDGGEIVVEQKIQIPVIKSGGFYNTVERCTLSWLDREIKDKAREAFNRLPEEQKHKLQFAPQDGEFVERVIFWKEMLKPVLTKKQCCIAVNCIIEWYIHIKQMRFGKGGVA